MTVYVDQAAVLFKGKPRHHMTADTLSELHAFAQRAGIRRCWYHPAAGKPHYDVTDAQRETALALGAQAASSREVLRVARQAATHPETT